MLRAGGSAVDAAIAVQMVLSLVEPQSSGIGGGAFMLHYDAASKDIDSYDGRETAPANATEDLFLTADGKPMQFMNAVVGGRAVGAPGVVAMMAMAHSDHGILPWSELFRPAIELAKNGFSISKRLSVMISSRAGDHLMTFPKTREYFFPNGQALEEGQIRRNSELAETLTAIAQQGPEVFYSGEIANRIVDAVQTAPGRGGLLSQSDLAEYVAKRRPPVCYWYRGYQVCGMGPPSSGAMTIGQILGILQAYDLSAAGADSPLSWHLFAEASKLAYADRNHYIADTDFINMPLEWMLKADYLAERSSLIDLESAMETPVMYGGPCQSVSGNCISENSQERSGTSHISVIDSQGNAVSMTTTIEGPFGSYLMVGGFLLNNQLTDFSFVPYKNGEAVVNRVEPRKRPRSSTSPTLVFNADGSLRLVIGSPGGSRIINYVAKTLIGVLDWGLDVQSAIDLGNVSNRNGFTELEEDTAISQLRIEFERLGHEVKTWRLVSGLHGIEIVNGVMRGGADPRREGIAVGE